jgi:hypothetical protein
MKYHANVESETYAEVSTPRTKRRLHGYGPPVKTCSIKQSSVLAACVMCQCSL